MHSIVPYQLEALEQLYTVFEHWSNSADSSFVNKGKNADFVCVPGCATCCTCNVTITALEGQRILAHADEQNLTTELIERIQQELPNLEPPSPSLQSNNAFATACLRGGAQPDDPPPTADTSRSCPFLDNQHCIIYVARPFHCRCFASRIRCTPDRPASVPGIYLQAATIVLQLIEHIAQRQIWGNMLDVLAVQLDIPGAPRKNAIKLSRPLPGFLLDEKEYEQLEPLLSALFSAPVQGYSLEEILNGKIPE